MASISTDKSGNRRILYFDENRKRRVLYIGRISEREAEGVQRRVESMLAARILGNAIDRDDARWLSESPTIREKLERLNLISSGKIAVDRKSMTMEEFLDDYIERQGKSRKPATVAVWKQVVANLKEFMPAGIKINQITAGHAKEFHEKLKARGMATTTIHKRLQFARQFMHDEGVRAAREIAKACPDTLCVCIGDSEADIYELLAEPLNTQNGQLHLLVRGCKDRVVNDPQFHKMLEVVRSQPVIQVRQIDVSKRTQGIGICKNKRTLSRDARTASVSVQAASVMIARPDQNDSKVSELKINLVLVEETCAPEGENPIRWYLLTTLPIDTLEAVSTVIEYYCNRWQIEIYFRTLKSGCKIEERYFERFTRLENCMAIYAIIAWRILYLCRLGEECPDVSCEVTFSPSEWKPIVKVVQRIEPSEPPSLSAMIKMVASLGGYVIRSNTKPGTQTLWLGLQRVHDFATAWDAFGPHSQIARGNSL